MSGRRSMVPQGYWASLGRRLRLERFPDGGQVVNSTHRRMLTRFGSAVLAGTLVFGVASCSDDDDADGLEEEIDEEFDQEEEELEEELEDELTDG